MLDDSDFRIAKVKIERLTDIKNGIVQINKAFDISAVHLRVGGAFLRHHITVLS